MWARKERDRERNKQAKSQINVVVRFLSITFAQLNEWIQKNHRHSTWYVVFDFFFSQCLNVDHEETSRWFVGAKFSCSKHKCTNAFSFIKKNTTNFSDQTFFIFDIHAYADTKMMINTGLYSNEGDDGLNGLIITMLVQCSVMFFFDGLNYYQFFSNSKWSYKYNRTLLLFDIANKTVSTTITCKNDNLNIYIIMIMIDRNNRIAYIHTIYRW